VERFFFSRFNNKVDRKGRVSVPARWRPILAAQSYNGCVVCPSPVVGAIEGCGMVRLERVAESIDTLNPYSDQHGDFAAALLSRSTPLPFDGEGRVVLPPELIEYAGIGEIAAFVGRGATFQIWNPADYDAYEREALRRAREQAPGFALLTGGGGRQEDA
jgi:transcriptional regulator MraZ